METSQTLIDVENEQNVVDERHLKEVEHAVRQRIEGLRGFGNIDGREGMNKTSERLQQRLEAWLHGIYDKVPADFQEIARKGY